MSSVSITEVSYAEAAVNDVIAIGGEEFLVVGTQPNSDGTTSLLLESAHRWDPFELSQDTFSGLGGSVLRHSIPRIVPVRVTVRANFQEDGTWNVEFPDLRLGSTTVLHVQDVGRIAREEASKHLEAPEHLLDLVIQVSQQPQAALEHSCRSESELTPTT